MRRTLLTCLFLMVMAPWLLGSCDTKTKTVDSCGDGFLDPGEACDGSQMTATTCDELGYYDQQGVLTCKSDCTFELAVCTGGRCGDGNLHVGEGEQCDGENLAGATCANQGLGGGELACNEYCRFDISRCELAAECGDGTAASPYELCDGTDLDDQTCVTKGYLSGVLACNADCTAFDTSGCTNCGNEEVDDGETCDGANLAGQTCLGLGYSGGTLGCTATCAFDLSLCEAPVTCGNGQLDDGEQCDGALLNGKSCVTQGFASGTLSCRANCAFDTTGCTNCGNGALDAGETCDGLNLDGQSCVTQGWYGGTLSCATDCQAFNDASCVAAGQCGDQTIQAAHQEDCDGSALGGGTCVSEGFYEGTLACGSDCRYVTSGCSGSCGDGEIQTEFETCEGTNLAGATCQSLGYSPRGGTLWCTPECGLDEAACVAKSGNANLATLTVTSGTLTPAFSATTTTYTVTVPLAVESLTVAGTPADAPYATVTITPVQPIALVEGANSATVTVTAEDGTLKPYTVTVMRQTTLNYESASIGTLIYVPAGTFQRDATATNLSLVTAFRMSKYEITRAQWTAVTGWSDPSSVTYSSGTEDPVQMVNWYHAIAFCNKLSILEGLTQVYAVSGVDFAALTYAQIPTSTSMTWNAATADWAANGYRLPTEMEWMWAAMGADSASPGVMNTTGYEKAFAGSTGSNLIDEYAWYTTNSGGKSHPVGTRLENELGFHDLSGNVWEWVWDWYGTYPPGTLTDARGPASGTNRVGRGGGRAANASYCAVAHRGGNTPYGRSSDFGFRVVRP